jgi:hypothetical protein
VSTRPVAHRKLRDLVADMGIWGAKTRPEYLRLIRGCLQDIEDLAGRFGKADDRAQGRLALAQAIKLLIEMDRDYYRG